MDVFNKPLSKGMAVLLSVITFFVVGGLNELFVIKVFGAFGGTLLDILGIFALVKIWRMTSKKHAPQSDTLEK